MRNATTGTLIAACLLCACSALKPTGLAAREPLSENLRRGMEFHDAARDNPVPSIEKGKALLYPSIDADPLARAYYGSLLTIEAGAEAEKKNLIQSLTLLGEGSAFVDEAVARAPDNAEIRIVRMVNAWEVSASSPLNRYPAMKEDIDWYAANGRNLTARDKGIFELYRGLYLVKAERIEEGLDAFDRCIAVSPGSTEAAAANRQLLRYAE